MLAARRRRLRCPSCIPRQGPRGRAPREPASSGGSLPAPFGRLDSLAADGAPDPDLRVPAGHERRGRQLDHDREHIEARHIVHARGSERTRGGGIGQLRQRPGDGFRSGMIRKNCSRSMKNGSSRQPANTCRPLALPRTVLIAPETAGATLAILFPIAPATGGATGPRTLTVCSAPVPSKLTWMTLSSTPSVLLSILNWYSRLGSK